MAKVVENKKAASKTTIKTSPPKKASGKWNISISVAENGYVVRVYEQTNEYPAKEFTFIAANEKELNAIVEKYK